MIYAEPTYTEPTCKEPSLRGARLVGAILLEATLVDADLRDVQFSEHTMLPDGTKWTPNTNMARFTDPDYADFWNPPNWRQIVVNFSAEDTQDAEH